MAIARSVRFRAAPASGINGQGNSTGVPEPLMGEFAYIDWLRRRTPADPRVLIGPGDDCAAVRFAPDAGVQ